MQVFSIARSFAAAGGHRIIRPTDKSCWILISPCGRYRFHCFTRREAQEQAIQRSTVKR